ncbi:MAG: hypothetical protein AMS18_09380 [Gemmatimonas sp. SG8_17]|nr:MAG: hypothetical protein AMS18_09380 [Gemmatimonas sp. SG8_17]
MGQQGRSRTNGQGGPGAVDGFFEYARERQLIKLRRDAGESPPFTGDPVLRAYRFCNVFREDDRTTAWFRQNVRDVLRESPTEVTLATITFRWFNRIEVGEQILDILLEDGWNAKRIRSRLRNVQPLVTGAYMVKTPPGMSKLEGIIWCMKHINRRSLPQMPMTSLELAHQWLTQYPYLGDFMAYEVITDLRHTFQLQDATDIMTWANPGPGAARGCEWITGHKYNRHSKTDRVAMMNVMRELLRLANSDEAFLWPEDWPRWEMREVEHTLCEYDKYMRAVNGQSLKRRFDASHQGEERT